MTSNCTASAKDLSTRAKRINALPFPCRVLAFFEEKKEIK